MERFVILTLNWLYEKRHNVIIFLAYIILAALLLKQHVYFAFALMFLISLKETYPISKKPIKIAKSAFMIKFYNIFIWFLSYVISLKVLSYSIGISEDKLKYAPVIMAIPVSIILIYMLIALASLFMLLSIQVLAQLSFFMTTKLKTKITKSEYYIFASRFYYLMVLLVPFLLAVAYISPYFIRVALFTDSTFISDCGEKEKNRTYIRVDDKSCLVFNLNWSVITETPKKIISDEKK
ncbi:hypothetical protein [Serratia symbiotica]|uniref:Uncharacterized protein n=1 Tax=Serratia symbiotica TaxID=138074 RepID=A0A7D5SG24_9GAMM|nr:hypothetical protein [Serratia symbiotica]QLH62872.1 hypothetical protein SYMBAF_07925 [Serratia symbiotica]